MESIKEHVVRDPGLPRENATASYWQHIPSPLAAIQSPSMPTAADIVIIGSGITGASVAKTLLEQTSSTSIVILEARTLCSGATGRNGGQLATNAGEIYAQYRETFGPEQAGKISRFTFKTCEKMKDIIREYASEEAEYRNVTKVRAYLDEASFVAIKDSVTQLETDHEDLRGIYDLVDSSTMQKNYGVHGSHGGVTLPAGVLWPYRLTPVTAISFTDGQYTIDTPRGKVLARQVVHCTNGYAGHLLPAIRGLLFPLCGTMTVQDLKAAKPIQAGHQSFGIHYTPVYDAKDETLADGLVYMTQNAKLGYYFIGGEKSKMADTLTADDTKVCRSSVQQLQQTLSRVFDHGEVTDKSLISAWTGIMGFTLDSVPYVGRLTNGLTGREGSEEWIAAGFNGYGMPYCWGTGEALASMILGTEVGDDFPEAFMLSEERLSPDRIELLVGHIASLRSSGDQTS